MLLSKIDLQFGVLVLDDTGGGNRSVAEPPDTS